MFHVAAFYKFCPLDASALPALRETLRAYCAEQALRGLFLLAPEGVNATLCGTRDAIADLLAYLESLPEIGALSTKYSTCETQTFSRLKVEIRPEIVSLKRPDIVPSSAADATHLSPTQWHERVTSGEDVVLLDTRNDFEIGIGAFRGAIAPRTTDFAQFPGFAQGGELPHDKPILMYCTGGIRCEKAALVLQEAGYTDVFQLDGGILNYLEQFPNGEFEGECFVFDRRVAVDRALKPTTTYTICPLCGDPASTVITCEQCSQSGVVCSRCATTHGRHVCSQNCEYHFSLRTTSRQYRHHTRKNKEKSIG